MKGRVRGRTFTENPEPAENGRSYATVEHGLGAAHRRHLRPGCDGGARYSATLWAGLSRPAADEAGAVRSR